MYSFSLGTQLLMSDYLTNPQYDSATPGCEPSAFNAII